MDRRPGLATEAPVETTRAFTVTLTQDQVYDLARERGRRHRRAIGRMACGHLSTVIPCRICQRSARRAQAEIRAMEPVSAPSPSTFLLTDDALRREGNRLVLAHEWSLREVTQVLALEIPGTAA